MTDQPNITFISANSEGEYIAYQGIVDLQAQIFRLLPEATRRAQGGALEQYLEALRTAGRHILAAQARDGSAFFIAKAPEQPGDVRFWYYTVIRMMRRAMSARNPKQAARALQVSLRQGFLARFFGRWLP
ncbi:MAG: hypothetical protein CUN49_06680 [Candidatus Thermofonsia Clade 1 bacterium]|jgi:hypothetical protein|uniref:Uncharacterized protein n=1 Tax=Candidatus Thermofonsia Clade 1 bacterium TaxID=2364210 RepID=A0A2M8PF61_9CHLR|nr:MAG: hypothetical protein CUN49_06680 [Candidatus Thermofonsia Clade 1 bacterium]RMF53202.1 MAG: hypothetical protein D6749_02855 [Chloroflexota bacterium]